MVNICNGSRRDETRDAADAISKKKREREIGVQDLEGSCKGQYTIENSCMRMGGGGGGGDGDGHLDAISTRNEI